MAWFWLLPPRSEIAWPPAPVIVSPRSVTNFDCWNRTPWPLVHWVVGGVRTTLPTGAAGGAGGGPAEGRVARAHRPHRARARRAGRRAEEPEHERDGEQGEAAGPRHRAVPPSAPMVSFY